MSVVSIQLTALSYVASLLIADLSVMTILSTERVSRECAALKNPIKRLTTHDNTELYIHDRHTG